MPSPRDPERRDRILDAASTVFAAQGFAGARVDDIAARAGINKAMLYYHVGDKTALYSAVLLRNFDRVRMAIDEALTAGGTARQRLEAVITALTRMVQRHPDHPRMMLREIASGAASLEPEVLAAMLEVLGVVRGLIAEGTAAGEFRPLDPVLTHLTLVGAVVFLNATWPIRDRAAALGPGFSLPEPTADIAAFINQMMLDGLAADR
ncbi:MAG TPA: TetR/AcrR family transcriptional regulator [Thermoanaerobaculales bacterium]|nr:TetR/AcrR family transcriptional regulator [Thermoanaerobaculales bacterium]HQL28981.1 TetR/AcrR family transcriptional regulator [Thermoanaerobaculales bacterium]HQN96253.1 TetR/AcrR family transcriptional regulator [Thermoanaerobaculales bacterium]HQP42305.1 TetR/AcrR family transcriptional regulator [Thermoanaerobaculales bacterium]